MILMCKVTAFVWGWSFKTERLLMETFYGKDISKDAWTLLRARPNSLELLEIVFYVKKRVYTIV